MLFCGGARTCSNMDSADTECTWAKHSTHPKNRVFSFTTHRIYIILNTDIKPPTRPLWAVGRQCLGERERQGVTRTPKNLSPRQYWSDEHLYIEQPHRRWGMGWTTEKWKLQKLGKMYFWLQFRQRRMFSPYFYPTSHGLRVWIDITRLFMLPATIQTTTSSAAVTQLLPTSNKDRFFTSSDVFSESRRTDL